MTSLEHLQWLPTHHKGKGKVYHTPLRSHLPVLGLKPVGGEQLMSVMRGQGIIAHWLIPNYTAWQQRHMCVSNLPRVALDGKEARI